MNTGLFRSGPRLVGAALIIPLTAAASIAGATSTASASARHSAAPQNAYIQTSAKSVQWSKSLTVTGLLRSDHKGVAGQWGHLEHKVRGAGWKPVTGDGSRKTDAKGAVVWTVTPAKTSCYRVVFGKNAAVSPATAYIPVAPQIALNVGKEAPAQSRLQIHGTERPENNVRVKVEQRINNTWKTVATPKVHHGKFERHIDIAKKTGETKLRAFIAGNAEYSKSYTPVALLQIVNRSLSEGDTGKDVLQLQKRLRKLKYDVGAVNGSFGFDTFHAVTAFQKVQGLPDDGVVDAKTWSALASPKAIQLRQPVVSEGDSVQVSLKHQVVLLIKNGVLWRIVDSSTAGGYYYTDSEGQTEKAVTPTGHFTVQYKVDHWVHSSLGYLYRPAYFTNTGYAIHGETEVPAYPASHGCVRITVPAMDRYYNFFYDGESVYIYGKPPPGHE